MKMAEHTKRIKALAREGLNPGQIVTKLKKEKVLNTRKRPIEKLDVQSALSYYRTKSRKKKKRKSRVARKMSDGKTLTGGGSRLLSSIKAILEMKDLSSDRQVALIELLLK